MPDSADLEQSCRHFLLASINARHAGRIRAAVRKRSIVYGSCADSCCGRN
jgi:hypothetical protein